MKTLLIIALMSSSVAVADAGTSGAIQLPNGKLVAEETQWRPMKDQYEISAATLNAAIEIDVMLWFYGVEGNVAHSTHQSAYSRSGFFNTFFAPSSAFYLTAADENNLKELCGDEPIFQTKTALRETVNYGCTDSPLTTYVLVSSMRRLRSQTQALALYRARLYGWCLSFKAQLPYESCSTDGLAAIDRAMSEVVKMKTFFDHRNLAESSRRQLHYCSDKYPGEEDAMNRLQTAFEALGIK
jgi:hypothetical protein